MSPLVLAAIGEYIAPEMWELAAEGKEVRTCSLSSQRRGVDLTRGWTAEFLRGELEINHAFLRRSNSRTQGQAPHVERNAARCLDIFVGYKHTGGGGSGGEWFGCTQTAGKLNGCSALRYVCVPTSGNETKQTREYGVHHERRLEGHRRKHNLVFEPPNETPHGSNGTRVL